MNRNHLPLPLELTQPSLLVNDLDTQFRSTLDEYDPQTQLCGGGHGGKTSSNQASSIQCALNLDAIQADVQVDDVLVF
jgi:hypothetical protein